MEELFKTLYRMIDNQEKFNAEFTRRIEEQTRSLIEIDKRIGKIMEAAK